MPDALTQNDEQLMDRLIRLGIFAGRTEVMRAGLKELESKYFCDNYLNPPPLPKGTLAAIYKKQSGEDWPAE
jgi:hypothetical protein